MALYKGGAPQRPACNLLSDYSNSARDKTLRLSNLLLPIYTFLRRFRPLGHLERVHAFAPRNGGVGGLHGQRPLRALVYAAGALHAAEMVDRPLARLLVHLDGAAGAALLAQAAQDARVNVHHHMAFQPARRLFFLHRVQHRFGLFEQRPERHLSKFESAHATTFPCS